MLAQCVCGVEASSGQDRAPTSAAMLLAMQAFASKPSSRAVAARRANVVAQAASTQVRRRPAACCCASSLPACQPCNALTISSSTAGSGAVSWRRWQHAGCGRRCVSTPTCHPLLARPGQKRV